VVLSRTQNTCFRLLCGRKLIFPIYCIPPRDSDGDKTVYYQSISRRTARVKCEFAGYFRGEASVTTWADKSPVKLCQTAPARTFWILADTLRAAGPEARNLRYNRTYVCILESRVVTGYAQIEHDFVLHISICTALPMTLAIVTGYDVYNKFEVAPLSCQSQDKVI
jgi:hypothetical protein